MTANQIIKKYISFFEERGHKQIPNSPLIPENDPTTLFTSSGMQPLAPYLLGEEHPQGKKLVNIQNCFRAQDIDEVGDNRHTTFFRMLGNWSLGDYFKREQLNWFFEFLKNELRIDPRRLYVSVFEGNADIPKDEDSASIWKNIFEKQGINSEGRIFYLGVEDNWWSRSGIPENMPVGEIGGPDSEVYFDLDPRGDEIKGDFKSLSDSGRLLEIGNSVFIEYQKVENGFKKLPQSNVDFGAGLERLLAAVEDKADMFQTSLFIPVLNVIEKSTSKSYKENEKEFRIVADHLRSAVFISGSGIKPGNKEQGYVLRRLIRRSLDNFYKLEGKELDPIIETIVNTAKDTDDVLVKNFESIKNTIISEQQNYRQTLNEAKKFISKRYPLGDELKGVTKISADDAFLLYSTHGLSPTQIKSLGFVFDELDFADKMEEHSKISKKGSEKKFAGGLADKNEQTIRGHTATHLMHQALRDLFGKSVHQTGSNITAERVRFDFSYDKPLSDDEIKELEKRVSEKIEENLPVYFEFMSLEEAKKIGAIGLFDEKYSDRVKIYFIGSADSPQNAYSVEFCGGPHVNFTKDVKSFKIIKQESLGKGRRRLYAKVG